MEVSKEVLLKIVKATRISLRLEKIIDELFVEHKSRTWPETESGLLCDALFAISGERLTSKQDFRSDSRTMKLLTGTDSDIKVTETLMTMNKVNGEVQQPRPHTFTKEELIRLTQQNGGYQYQGDSPGYMMPEGDWK